LQGNLARPANRVSRQKRDFGAGQGFDTLQGSIFQEIPASRAFLLSQQALQITALSSRDSRRNLELPGIEHDDAIDGRVAQATRPPSTRGTRKADTRPFRGARVIEHGDSRRGSLLNAELTLESL
jgi:hypothetical protein